MRHARTFLLLSFIALCTSSCIVYGTLDLPATAATFNEFKGDRQWTIQRGTDSAYVAMIESVGPDTISVAVGDVKRKPDHAKGGKKRYWRAFGAKSNHVAHITLVEGVQIDDNLQLSYKDVKAVSVHPVSGLTVPISLVAGVLIFFLLGIALNSCFSCIF